MPFVTLCVTQWFWDVRWIGVRLRSPFRPSASHFDGAKLTKAPVTYVAICVVSNIAIKKRFYVQ
ncbi:hypothetical protein M3R28_18430 [Pseudomonas syringae]|nr:hypothetical protein [Pseudomonas syringae]MCL6308898.1 hypothetical protein [Pseudomonas syringae]